MAKELWGVEVVGPDDWYAAESLQAAREHAHALNQAIMRRPADEIELNVWAVPRLLDWSEADHTASLIAQKTSM
jgi:hypothetical protein